MMGKYYSDHQFFAIAIASEGILARMKNTASILNLVFIGTKLGLFCYFFQDIIGFIF